MDRGVVNMAAAPMAVMVPRTRLRPSAARRAPSACPANLQPGDHQDALRKPPAPAR
jgi:hypothetical protein